MNGNLTRSVAECSGLALINVVWSDKYIQYTKHNRTYLCKLSFLELDISYISCIYFTLLITFQQHGVEVSSRTYQWHSRLFLLLSAL